MADPLASARLKFRRAVEHLETLDDEVRRFVYHEIERLEAERDPERGEPIRPVWIAMPELPADAAVRQRIQLRHQLPPRFGVILGDYLSNLRSSLDHAVNGLAGTNAGTHTRFPIYAKSDGFKNGKRGDLEGVPAPRWADFERMQPYHGHRRGRLLLSLANLCNVDKHKVLHASSFLTYPGVWTFGRGIKAASTSFMDIGVLGDKAEVRITFEGPDGEPKMEGGAPYQITFDEGAGRPPLCTRLDLVVIRDEVRGIIAEIGNMVVYPPREPPSWLEGGPAT